jgi:transcriptional regulator with XRE-family HTH domain
VSAHRSPHRRYDGPGSRYCLRHVCEHTRPGAAVTALSDLLRPAATKAGLSAREIAFRATEGGYSLKHDTAARYLRGDHGRPKEATLIAFEQVLGIPLHRLRTAANLPAEQTAPYSPPPEASRLTQRQRRAVNEIIRAMLEPGQPAVADLATRRAAPSSRAARHGDPEQTTD